MPPASAQHTEDEEFTSFVDELSRNPDLEGLLLRLRQGHSPVGFQNSATGSDLRV